MVMGVILLLIIRTKFHVQEYLVDCLPSMVLLL
jgi:hypothetical protein